MNIIIVSKKRKLITTAILFITGLLLGFFISTLNPSFDHIRVGAMEVLVLILFPAINEIGQFLGFISFGGLKPGELRLLSKKGGVDLFISNLLPVRKGRFSLIILVPLFINTLTAIYLTLTSSNVFYALILSIALGVSGNDVAVLQSIDGLRSSSHILIDEDNHILIV